MSVHPIRDFIVVSKEATEEEVRPSGLVMVKTQEAKHLTGKVLKVGSGRVSLNGTVVRLEVAEGDRVVFNRNTATEVQDGHDTVFVIREDQVIAVLR